MVTKKSTYLIVLVLMAMGMLGVLLILAASAAPAAPLPTSEIHISPAYLTQTQATDVLLDDTVRTVIVADTRSMEPVLVAGDQVIERAPASPSEISLGDIITFASAEKGVTIIHRVMNVGSDDYGWYAVTKGDNAPNADSEIVRFPTVKGIVVAIVK